MTRADYSERVTVVHINNSYAIGFWLIVPTLDLRTQSSPEGQET